jgi:hypothetical protein
MLQEFEDQERQAGLDTLTEMGKAMLGGAASALSGRYFEAGRRGGGPLMTAVTTVGAGLLQAVEQLLSATDEALRHPPVPVPPPRDAVEQVERLLDRYLLLAQQQAGLYAELEQLRLTGGLPTGVRGAINDLASPSYLRETVEDAVKACTAYRAQVAAQVAAEPAP